MTAREECRRTYQRVRQDRTPVGRFMFKRCITFRPGSIGVWLDQSGAKLHAICLIDAALCRRQGAISVGKVCVIEARTHRPPALP